SWMRIACGLIAALAAAFWLSPNLGCALAVMIPLGATYLSVISSSNRVCLGHAPAGAQARVAGLFHTTLDATYAIGLIAAGAVADVVGLRQVGLTMTALFLVAVVALARSRRHL